MADGPDGIRVSTARPRYGARTGMFEAGFGRSHGWRRPKCRVRRSVRPDEGGEGIHEADGLPGEKTFGLMFNKKWVFPKSLAQARRAGETPSRARPSHSMGKATYGALLRKSLRRWGAPSPTGILSRPPLTYSELLLEQPLRAAICISANLPGWRAPLPRRSASTNRWNCCPNPGGAASIESTVRKIWSGSGLFARPSSWVAN